MSLDIEAWFKTNLSIDTTELQIICQLIFFRLWLDMGPHTRIIVVPSLCCYHCRLCWHYWWVHRSVSQFRPVWYTWPMSDTPRWWFLFTFKLDLRSSHQYHKNKSVWYNLPICKNRLQAEFELIYSISAQRRSKLGIHSHWTSRFEHESRLLPGNI